ERVEEQVVGAALWLVNSVYVWTVSNVPLALTVPSTSFFAKLNTYGARNSIQRATRPRRVCGRIDVLKLTSPLPQGMISCEEPLYPELQTGYHGHPAPHYEPVRMTLLRSRGQRQRPSAGSASAGNACFTGDASGRANG